MFSAENLVVYPAQGVGKIERIDHKDIDGATCDFYVVHIRANNIILMVPVNNAVNVGLRPLISRSQAKTILDFLLSDAKQTIFTGQNWNRRFKEYSGRLKSPDLSTVAEVLRELLIIGKGKELSFGERRLLEQAMALVSGELGEVLEINPDELKTSLLKMYAPPLQPEICGQL